MFHVEEITKGIQDLIGIGIDQGTPKVDIDQFLDTIITECIRLKNELPHISYRKYINEQLNHLKSIMDEGLSIEEDLDELIMDTEYNKYRPIPE